jgi:probable rRNA maturation factor
VTGEVRVEVAGLEAWPELADLEPVLLRAARMALATASAPLRGEISLTCVDAPSMARLNREWLGREGPTDVIAFDLGESAADGTRQLVGDIYLCPDVARMAADEPGGPEFGEEVVRLATHGVLHVLGHDHPEDESRWTSPMYRLQESVLARALEADPPEA